MTDSPSQNSEDLEKQNLFASEDLKLIKKSEIFGLFICTRPSIL